MGNNKRLKLGIYLKECSCFSVMLNRIWNIFGLIIKEDILV